jgi:hypothetical protein
MTNIEDTPGGQAAKPGPVIHNTTAPAPIVHPAGQHPSTNRNTNTMAPPDPTRTHQTQAALNNVMTVGNEPMAANEGFLGGSAW